MPTVDFSRLSFREAIDFFRQKVNIPSERWDDLWAEEHDIGFMVAGAARADLLADLRQAVDRAVADGLTRREFLGQFDAIAARHGWAYRGERNWRAGVVWQTNVRSAYAAGRWQQLNDPDLLAARPYWQWVHGDSVVPRPLHKALHGRVFPAGSAFWDAMFPPQGYGCKCTVVSLSDADLEREGLTVEQPPELGSLMDYRGDDGKLYPVRVEGAPGFSHAHGSRRSEHRQILQQVLERLPADLRQQVEREIAARAETRDDLARLRLSNSDISGLRPTRAEIAELIAVADAFVAERASEISVARLANARGEPLTAEQQSLMRAVDASQIFRQIALLPDTPERQRFGVQRDGNLIAVAATTQSGEVLVLNLIAASSLAQSSGAGTALIELLLRWMLARNLSVLQLEATDRARGFYERLGFERLSGSRYQMTADGARQFLQREREGD